METFVCSACGAYFAASEEPPAQCPICEDLRQPVPPSGQRWTTPAPLRASHDSAIRVLERDPTGAPALIGIGLTPGFAISQRALLVRTERGNVLWDCTPLLDDTIRIVVEALGGIDVIAISHPHYYSAMVDWARTFGARLLLHEADRAWVTQPDPIVEHWAGETLELPQGPTLVRAGGHFPGGTVLHWAEGAGGAGALLAGDILTVLPDARKVSFMYAYPMQLPLPAWEVEHVMESVEPYPFDRLYGAWWERVIPSGAKQAVAESGALYLDALAGRLPGLRAPRTPAAG
ncbi:MAG: MBL fold metallo-hydrolase [Candidatus Dormiibacterota bacterium]